MDFDYNTSRKKMSLPEYGRNIQKMVDYIKSIHDKDLRTKAARSIIKVIGNMNPYVRDNSTHKLWAHLYIMADFDLDIDAPCELPKKEHFEQKPKKISYSTNSIRYKHYGKVMEMLADELGKQEDSKYKDVVVLNLANHMKRLYLMWSRDNVTDDIIIKDFKELSNGNLKLNEPVRLNEIKDFRSPRHNTNHPKRKYSSNHKK